MSERDVVRQSPIWPPETIEDIQLKAELGRYRIRGFSALRSRPLPSFDDLTFIPCTLTRIPLEGGKGATPCMRGASLLAGKSPISAMTP